MRILEERYRAATRFEEVSKTESAGGKGGNNVEVTQWRNREARRTHEILKELERIKDAQARLAARDRAAPSDGGRGGRRRAEPVRAPASPQQESTT